jgi:hypothetical protein
LICEKKINKNIWEEKFGEGWNRSRYEKKIYSKDLIKIFIEFKS